MFKNVIPYRITALAIDALGANEALESAKFVPCGASQEKSIGWVPPRGEAHGPLLESVGGQWIAKLMIETRSVPGSEITKQTAARIKTIEATTGRKPGKKETREIKDDIKLELMPMAFSKESSVWVWIDPAANLLVIDASSQSRADEVVTMHVKCIPGLALRLIDTKISPTAAMSDWLTDDEPYNGERNFEVGRECELKASDESKAVVKYGRHPLDIEEVAQHIRNGKMPTKLALTWDSRVSFMLTEGLQVKKLAFLDVVFDGASSGKDDDFDADVLITTSELRKMLPDLLDALGGEGVLVDITLRMLKPSELFQAQSFPRDYVIHEIPNPALLFVNGKQVGNPLTVPRIPLTGTAQVRMCGNSVAPKQAEALARANFGHEALIYGRKAA